MRLRISVIVPTAAIMMMIGMPVSAAHPAGPGPEVVPYLQTPQAMCDSATISADVGEQLQVLRCYPGWAYVTNGELGDSTSLMRMAGDSWTRYTGFPSSICKDRAANDGVPGSELSSFTRC